MSRQLANDQDLNGVFLEQIQQPASALNNLVISQENKTSLFYVTSELLMPLAIY
jgi:hypothetical protein